MQIDLLKHGIRVTAIHPRAVETEFSIVRFKGNEGKAKSAYTGVHSPAGGRCGRFHTLLPLPGHVCINDLVITCTQQADAIYFSKNPG